MSLPQRGFRILVASPDLLFEEMAITDPRPTGRQLAESFGKGDPDELIVLQVLENGLLEELRPDETTDLTGKGKEKFVIARSDRSFRLVIEGQRQEWPVSVITAKTVKALANKVGDEYVVLEQSDAPDRILEDDEPVLLTKDGVERFRFDVAAQAVTVNGRPIQLKRKDYSGLEIKQQAISQGVSIQIDFVLSLVTGPGQTKIVGDNDRISVRAGQQFIAIADDDNS